MIPGNVLITVIRTNELRRGYLYDTLAHNQAVYLRIFSIISFKSAAN
jgi:hypothetical protein